MLPARAGSHLLPTNGKERALSPQETAVLALGKWWDRCHRLVQSLFLQRETTKQLLPSRYSLQLKPVLSYR